MRKIYAVFLNVLLPVFLLVACGGSASTSANTDTNQADGFSPKLTIFMNITDHGTGLYGSTKDGAPAANFITEFGDTLPNTSHAEINPFTGSMMSGDTIFGEAYHGGDVYLWRQLTTDNDNLVYSTGNESVITAWDDSVKLLTVKQYNLASSATNPVDTKTVGIDQPIVIQTSLGPTVTVWYNGGIYGDVQ